MKEEVIANMEDFLNDFGYFRQGGFNVFSNNFPKGSKLVVINSTPYDDGLMLEIQLAITIDEVEEVIFRFNRQRTDKLSFTYWKNLSLIDETISKRNFIQNRIELSKVQAEIENSLVRKGFQWLDKLSDVSKLSKHLSEVIFSGRYKPNNLFKLCQRSYLLKFLNGESITDSMFYKYYEQMQIDKVPEHQLADFLEFKSFLKPESI